MIANQEVELKLETDPAGLDKLIEAPILAAVAMVELEQTSTYFDTPCRALQKAGFSLRIRKIGSRRIQTVKAESRDMAGLFARPEWELPIANDEPVIDNPRIPLQAMIPPGELQQLSPIFRIVVTRQKRMITLPEAQVELVFDRGEIQAEGETGQICEVELELKKGSPAALFKLAHRLGESAPLSLTTHSKSQRGYALLARDKTRPVKWKTVDLAPAIPSSEGFQAIARACIRQFRLNQSLLLHPKGEAATAETLHQARVSLRRLRSAMSIFRRMLADDRFDHLHRELRWIAGEMDMARDIDVLIQNLPDGSADTKLQEARAQAYHSARAALDSPRLRVLMLALVEWIMLGKWLTCPADRVRVDRPLVSFAAKILDRSRRRVKRHGRHLNHLDGKERHRLRIEVKKLRYAVDFFMPLFQDPKACRRGADFLAALQALQDHLGALNDQIAGASLLSRFEIADTRAHEASHRTTLESAVEAYDALLDVRRFWR